MFFPIKNGASDKRRFETLNHSFFTFFGFFDLKSKLIAEKQNHFS